MAEEQASPWSEPPNLKRNLRLLRTCIWLVTIFVGFVQAWSTRFWISGDGNNYLDVASYYLHGDWSHAINGYWSPAFSWLLALCLGIFRTGPYWDSTVVHLLDFAGLLVALFSFETFFRALLRTHIQLHGPEKAQFSLSESGWWTLGYSIFLSSSLLVLSAVETTPDIWVAAFTYLSAGLILRIAYNRGSWRLFVLLGLALGCAYLTKTFYFPMSFVFLLTAWLAAGNPRKSIKQAGLGFLAFVIVAGPWIVVLSRAKQRFTFGDVGKLAFAITNDRLSQHFFWQGEHGTGIPKHPVRQLMFKPRLFEFATPVGGSYPPSYDFSYWMEGVRPHFLLSGLLKVLRQSSGTFFQIWTSQLEYSLACLTLFFILPAKADWFLILRKLSYLWAPPLIACLNYSIVLVEARYVAPFILLLWVTAFTSLLGPKSQVPRRFAQALVFAVLIITGLRLAKSTGSALASILAGQQNVNWQVAEKLRTLGLQPGNRVARVSADAGAHWARIAGVKIVAEIPIGDDIDFWTADAVEKQRVLRVIARTGAKFVVTKDPPACAVSDGWISLGGTGYFAYPLLSAVQGDTAP